MPRNYQSNAESRLAAKRESEKRRRAEESKEQQGNRLEAGRERKNRKRAEESKEQQGNRLEADRERKNRKRAEELPEQRGSRLAGNAIFRSIAGNGKRKAPSRLNFRTYTTTC